jgi:hypothetical protein
MKGQKMNDDQLVRFTYLRQNKTNHNHGGVVIAASIKDGNTLKVGFAFCSPKDIFIRKVGRNKANGRLNGNSPICIPFIKNTFTSVVKYWNESSYIEKPQFCKDWTISEVTGEIKKSC